MPRLLSELKLRPTSPKERQQLAHPALKPALAKKIIEGADYLKIAPTLVHCAKDVALPKLDIAMPKAPADLSKIYEMKEQYGLGASVDRLITALKW